MSESTLVICSECGVGNLVWRADRQWFTCSVCESEITWADIEFTGFVGADGLVYVVDDES